jgi:aspartate-semialdehyde dehydrogenase
MDELRRLVGVEAAVQIVRVPVFSGVAATVHLATRADLDPEGLGKILEAGGVAVAKPGIRNLPRPRKVEGQMFAQVARIRRDPSGKGLSLWCAFDNLRGTAGAMVGAGAILLGDRVRGRKRPEA